MSGTPWALRSHQLCTPHLPTLMQLICTENCTVLRDQILSMFFSVCISYSSICTLEHWELVPYHSWLLKTCLSSFSVWTTSPSQSDSQPWPFWLSNSHWWIMFAELKMKAKISTFIIAVIKRKITTFRTFITCHMIPKKTSCISMTWWSHQSTTERENTMYKHIATVWIQNVFRLMFKGLVPMVALFQKAAELLGSGLSWRKEGITNLCLFLISTMYHDQCLVTSNCPFHHKHYNAFLPQWTIHSLWTQITLISVSYSSRDK